MRYSINRLGWDIVSAQWLVIIVILSISLYIIEQSAALMP